MDTVDVWVVMEGDSVIDVINNYDDAELLSSSYSGSVVEGPFTVEVSEE